MKKRRAQHDTMPLVYTHISFKYHKITKAIKP
jgi:hypothetical protein